MAVTFNLEKLKTVSVSFHRDAEAEHEWQYSATTTLTFDQPNEPKQLVLTVIDSDVLMAFAKNLLGVAIRHKYIQQHEPQQQ